MSEPTIQNYGGQINYATGNAKIIASQIIGESGTDFEQLSNKILKELSQLKQEDAETISDTIDLLKEELTRETPRTGRLRNAVTLLAPMITIVNGFPTLAQNLQSLVSYIQSLIH